MNAEKTPVEMVADWAKKRPHDGWLFQPQQGTWKVFTWAQAFDQIARMASALKAMALPPGSRICISGRNTAHWIMADLAILMAGHISIGLYPKQASKSTRYIFEHSEARVLFLGPMPDAADFMSAVLAHVVTIGFPYPETPPASRLWDELVATHEPMQNFQPPPLDSLLTLIYTSGTTGLPKAVMLSYRNLIFTTLGVMKQVPPLSLERYFSYMPLAHAFERTAIELGSLYNGGEIHFMESLDKLGAQLAEVAPTRFFGVPLVYSRIQAGVLKKISPAKLDFLLSIPLLNRWLRQRLLRAMGLQNVKLCVVGAAPMPPALLQWFRRIGLEIYQAYGLTEGSVYPVGCKPGQSREGSVGIPLPETGFKLSDEGEILFKHAGVMQGYYRDEAATQMSFTADGYLRTGDKGRLDADGYLYITGRIKDIFKTAKGKYVAPAPIEGALARNTDIDQLLFVGTNLVQPIMLVSLNAAAREKTREEVADALQTDMDDINATLEPHEQIGKCVIVKDTWTIDNGLLTPTLKVKRSEVEARYADLLQRESKTRNGVSWE